MTRAIVFVPGKSPKPPPPIHRNYLWRCLRRGVSRCDPDIGEQLDECRFDIAAWSFLYYEEHESLISDVPWIERLIESEGATEDDIRQARHWSKWLTRLMYTLGDSVHSLANYLPDARVKAMIQDTLRYYDNTEGVADRVRDRVKRDISRAVAENESVCLIGHSMGSVIAYEALWALTHVDRNPARIEMFLTLGSPLGMNYVQRRLPGFRDEKARYPSGIRRWVNVSAVGDLVSVDESVSDDFAPMVHQGLVDGIEDIHGDVYTAFRNENGLNAHRSYGYLVHPKVGSLVARWWRNGAE